jgi:receptor protein-tyrosine kinase
MTTDRATHLVERAAALLRRGAGLAAETDAELAVAASPPPVIAAAPPPDRVEAPPPPARPWPAAEPPGLRAMAPPPPHEPPRLDLETMKLGGLVLAGRERTRISEEYRITVGRILRALRATKSGAEPSNLLMVTSAKPGEGKSFTAMNVAASIAQNGLGEVLLVDMDAKPKSLSALMGLSDAPGMFNLVANPALRIEDVMVRTAIGGLSYLPIGSRDVIASEPGVTRPVSAAIERLSRRFAHHFIILDCAPCLSTSDPSTLAALVDQIVMVVEAERTQRSELDASLELIKSCPNITLVLNKVRLTTSHTFGAYYYYGARSY